MFKWIYTRSLTTIILAIIVGCLFWTMLGYRINKCQDNENTRRRWELLNLILLLISVAGILYVTLLSRSLTDCEVQLIPFYSFVEAKVQPEMYRTMLMNVLLFMPVGLVTPYAILSQHPQKKCLTTIYLALLLSVMIEILQYILHLGRVETDDVICNTLGGAIGAMGYNIVLKQKSK